MGADTLHIPWNTKPDLVALRIALMDTTFEVVVAQLGP